MKKSESLARGQLAFGCRWRENFFCEGGRGAFAGKAFLRGGVDRGAYRGGLRYLGEGREGCC